MAYISIIIELEMGNLTYEEIESVCRLYQNITFKKSNGVNKDNVYIFETSSPENLFFIGRDFAELQIETEIKE